MSPAPRALGVLKRNRAEKDSEYRDCLGSLAYVYDTSKRPAKALPIELQLLALQKQALGLEHPKTALALHHLGSIYLTQQDYAKALEYERQAADIFCKTLGEKARQSTTSLGNIAWLLGEVADRARQREDFPAARKASAESIAAYTRVFGAQHWTVTDARLEMEYDGQLEKMSVDARKQLNHAQQLWSKAKNASDENFHEALLSRGKRWRFDRSSSEMSTG